MSQGDDWQTSAISEPNMKIVLETGTDQPETLTEWTTTSWAGQPNETYDLEGATWRATGFRQEQEPDGTVVYRVTVVSPGGEN